MIKVITHAYPHTTPNVHASYNGTLTYISAHSCVGQISIQSAHTHTSHTDTTVIGTTHTPYTLTPLTPHI